MSNNYSNTPDYQHYLKFKTIQENIEKYGKYQKKDVDRMYAKYYDFLTSLKLGLYEITCEDKRIVIDLDVICEIFFDQDPFYEDHPFFEKYKTIIIEQGTNCFQVVPYNQKQKMLLHIGDQIFGEYDRNQHLKIDSFLSHILPQYFQEIVDMNARLCAEIIEREIKHQ